MSRGLGWLQREILDTLDAAKAMRCRVEGGMVVHKGLGAGQGRITRQGYTIILPDGVYDLRASLRFLAERHDQTFARGRSIDGSFAASFSRAATTLMARELLVWCSEYGTMPLPSWSPYTRPQRRFVRLPLPEPTPLGDPFALAPVSDDHP